MNQFLKISFLLSTLTLGFSARVLAVSAEAIQSEKPWQVSSFKPPVLANICGNGIIEEGEVCDGGPNCAGDCQGGVSNSSAPDSSNQFGLADQNDFEFTNPSDNSADNSGGHEVGPVEKPDLTFQGQIQACGNGIRESEETCDDGNQIAGDGCDTNCELEISPNDSAQSAQTTSNEHPATDGIANILHTNPSQPASGGCSVHGLQPHTNALTVAAWCAIFLIPALVRKRFSCK